MKRIEFRPKHVPAFNKYNFYITCCTLLGYTTLFSCPGFVILNSILFLVIKRIMTAWLN